MDAEKVGTWNAFDRSDIVEQETLGDAVDNTGHSVDHMNEAKLTDRDGLASDKAYVTDYGHNDHSPMAPTKKQAHSQMAVSASLDAMGVEAPRHHFDSETNKVYVESVSRPGYDAEIAEDVSTEYADRIDQDQMVDMMAANLVVGNRDLKADNIMVGEDGKVMTFDYDITADYKQAEDAGADATQFIMTARRKPATLGAGGSRHLMTQTTFGSRLTPHANPNYYGMCLPRGLDGWHSVSP
jgi:hypothetical protein